MTKKRFIKKCMSCGFSRNEARLLCKYTREACKMSEKENKMLKAFGINERRPLYRYSGIYRLRYAFFFLIKRMQKKTQEIKPLSNGKADGLRATVTNIDEMHTYRKEDHEKEAIY